MASPTVPFIECDQTHAGLAVSDLAAALEFYTKKLGFQQAFTWGEPPTFAGVNLGKVQMFLAAGTPTPSPDTGAVYFLVGDADASRLVGKPDQTLVQGQLNQPVTSANFREDLNADGRIKNVDVQLVKTNRGHSIQ